MKTLYHSTQQHNLSEILSNGLKPQLGSYAKEMGEITPSIWFFPTLEDAEEMTPIWLEPFYEDDMTILKITVPDDFPIGYTGSDYEVTTTKSIPAEWIEQL